VQYGVFTGLVTQEVLRGIMHHGVFGGLVRYTCRVNDEE
jgi:hypothetical protein